MKRHEKAARGGAGAGTVRATRLAVALALAGGGCGDPASGSAAPVTPRVNAVTASASTATSEAALDAFCDVATPAATARTLAYPALDLPAPPAPAAPAWRWVNVWATWCKPCVDEIPMLGRWREKLAKEGLPLEVQLLSVDESPEVIAAWRKDHPAVPESLRLKESAGLGAFIASLGLDAAATIPIHVFVDPAGKIRCVRTGALSETDYDAVKRLLSGA